MTRVTRLIALLILILAAVWSPGCSKQEATAGAPLQPAVAPLGPEAKEVTELPADVSAAMDLLQGQLKQRLGAALAKGGPAAAADACRAEAAEVTAKLQGDGLKVGRTSHALRSPANAAPAWAASWVAGQGGRKVGAGPKLAEADLPGGRKGYLRVIGTAPVCLSCHGAPASLDPAVQKVLALGYPQDRATGFAENDVRGWFWVEAGK